MKLRKLLSIMLTFATVICMFTVCSVPASARATAWVTLTSDPSYGGKVSFDGSDWGGYIGRSLWIDEETVMIYAKAEAGYKFVKWGAPVNSTQTAVKVTGLQDKGSYSITAYFEKIPEPEYNIAVRNGTAKDYGSQQNVTSSVAGRKIMITAYPAPQSGMVFDKWVVTGGQASLANPSEVTTTFTMPANAVTLEATYKQSDPNAGKKVSIYFIQGDKYGNGEYELQVPYGTTFELPPNPFDTVRGYEFTGWHEAETTKSYKPGDKAVATESTYYVADYKGLPVTVSFEIYDNNTASGTMRSVQVERGTYYTLPECTFTPKKGYVFDEWMMYGAPGTSIQLGNSDEVMIWAKFKEDPDYSPYCIITFDNGYKGSKHDTYTEKALKNSTYKLPENSFTRPETDVKFKYWDMGKPGKTIEIGDENEITITAQWIKSIDLSECIVSVKTCELGNIKNSKDLNLYANYVYRGEPIIPIFSVTSKSGTVLSKDVDFEMECSNNINAGNKAKLTLKGINGNTGTKSVYFKIYKLPSDELLGRNLGALYGYKLDIRLSDAKYTINSINGSKIYYYLYTGKKIEPKAEIYLCTPSKEYLLPSSNFKITYHNLNGKKADSIFGDYYVDVKSTGKNVSDIGLIFSKNYSIIPPDQSVKKLSYSTDGKHDGMIRVAFTKLTKKFNKIEIQVSTSSKFSENKTKSFFVEGKDIQIKYVKLKNSWLNKKRKYYVRVRYVIDSDAFSLEYGVGNWSKTKTITM